MQPQSPQPSVSGVSISQCPAAMNSSSNTRARYQQEAHFQHEPKCPIICNQDRSSTSTRPHYQQEAQFQHEPQCPILRNQNHSSTSTRPHFQQEAHFQHDSQCPILCNQNPPPQQRYFEPQQQQYQMYDSYKHPGGYNVPLSPTLGPYTGNSRSNVTHTPTPAPSCTGKCNTSNSPNKAVKALLQVDLPDFLVARHKFCDKIKDVSKEHGVTLRDPRKKKLYMEDPNELLQLMREYLFYRKLCTWIKGEMECKRNELLDKAKELIDNMDMQCLSTNILPIDQFQCPQLKPSGCLVTHCSEATKKKRICCKKKVEDCDTLIQKGKKKLEKEREKLKKEYERDLKKREKEQERQRREYEKSLARVKKDKEREKKREELRKKKIAEFERKLKANEQKRLETENLICNGPQKEIGDPKGVVRPTTTSESLFQEETIEFECCEED